MKVRRSRVGSVAAQFFEKAGRPVDQSEQAIVRLPGLRGRVKDLKALCAQLLDIGGVDDDVLAATVVQRSRKRGGDVEVEGRRAMSRYATANGRWLKRSCRIPHPGSRATGPVAKSRAISSRSRPATRIHQEAALAADDPETNSHVRLAGFLI